ncbi:hypothetical protein UFOVP786_67 [uncultured Caudovirales phage]|uniref:DUF7443 domain-containing protein n=1 Tax=uncultured Caudovirales phage TaxID=2100421 RepID=A0A6J5NZK9_9CAUD|nr:hypothetical protein UFOVP786_67 [uncultured Caudovirales phage]
MPVRVAMQRITTSRDGQRVSVKPGEVFDFTDEEITSLAGQTPPALRRPVKEELPPAPEPAARPVRKTGKAAAKDDEL